MTEHRSTETRQKAKAGLVSVRIGNRCYWVPTDVARRIERVVAKAAVMRKGWTE